LLKVIEQNIVGNHSSISLNSLVYSIITYSTLTKLDMVDRLGYMHDLKETLTLSVD